MPEPPSRRRSPSRSEAGRPARPTTDAGRDRRPAARARARRRTRCGCRRWPSRRTLDELLPPLVVDPQAAACARPAGRGAGRLTAPVGHRGPAVRAAPRPAAGRPGRRRRQRGHRRRAAVAARARCCARCSRSLALTHTPARGAVLLPRLRRRRAARRWTGCRTSAGVAGRRDAEAVRRTVAEVTALLDEREARFAAARHRLDGRRTAAAGPPASSPTTRSATCSWSSTAGARCARSTRSSSRPITNLAARGLGFGIHVVLDRRPLGGDPDRTCGTCSARSWSCAWATRPSPRSTGGRPRTCPSGSPGRGLTRGQAALPGRAARASTAGATIDDLADGDRRAGRRRSRRPGRASRRRRCGCCRASCPSASWPRVVDRRRRRACRSGSTRRTLAPVYLDLDAEPHLIVFGDAECGKTNLLRLIARTIAERYTPGRRPGSSSPTTGAACSARSSGDHLLDYAPSSQAFAEMVGVDPRARCSNRLPGPDVTADQLRDRSWWTGPDLYILVDDYDLVAARRQQPAERAAGAAAAGPRHRAAPDRHPAGRRRGPGALRAGPATPARAGHARPADVRQPGGGRRCSATLRPSPQPPGRGTLVRRRDGQQLIQTAWSEPA